VRRLADAAGRPVHQHVGVSAFAEQAVCADAFLMKIRPELPVAEAALLGCALSSRWPPRGGAHADSARPARRLPARPAARSDPAAPCPAAQRLFHGRQAGSQRHPDHLRRRVTGLDIDCGAKRTGPLLQLASELSAAVLADTLASAWAPPCVHQDRRRRLTRYAVHRAQTRPTSTGRCHDLPPVGT